MVNEYQYVFYNPKLASFPLISDDICKKPQELSNMLSEQQNDGVNTGRKRPSEAASSSPAKTPVKRRRHDPLQGRSPSVEEPIEITTSGGQSMDSSPPLKQQKDGSRSHQQSQKSPSEHQQPQDSPPVFEQQENSLPPLQQLADIALARRQHSQSPALTQQPPSSTLASQQTQDSAISKPVLLEIPLTHSKAKVQMPMTLGLQPALGQKSSSQYAQSQRSSHTQSQDSFPGQRFLQINATRPSSSLENKSQNLAVVKSSADPSVPVGLRSMTAEESWQRMKFETRVRKRGAKLSGAPGVCLWSSPETRQGQGSPSSAPIVRENPSHSTESHSTQSHSTEAGSGPVAGQIPLKDQAPQFYVPKPLLPLPMPSLSPDTSQPAMARFGAVQAPFTSTFPVPVNVIPHAPHQPYEIAKSGIRTKHPYNPGGPTLRATKMAPGMPPELAFRPDAPHDLSVFFSDEFYHGVSVICIDVKRDLVMVTSDPRTKHVVLPKKVRKPGERLDYTAVNCVLRLSGRKVMLLSSMRVPFTTPNRVSGPFVKFDGTPSMMKPDEAVEPIALTFKLDYHDGMPIMEVVYFYIAAIDSSVLPLQELIDKGVGEVAFISLDTVGQYLTFGDDIKVVNAVIGTLRESNAIYDIPAQPPPTIVNNG